MMVLLTGQESDFNSTDCSQMVLHDRLPDTVLLLLENAINNANNNMKMGLLSIVTLPYAITADVVYATYLK